jgi:hypothetical protein
MIRNSISMKTFSFKNMVSETQTQKLQSQSHYMFVAFVDMLKNENLSSIEVLEMSKPE